MRKTNSEYLSMYKLAVIEQPAEVKEVTDKIQSFKIRYEKVSEGVIPWQFIGCIHYRESSLSFSEHLHNGDSLKRRTINVPAGRPIKGNPPFTWEESAFDALDMKGFYTVKDWSIENQLSMLERYNGMGYAKYHPEVNSPYLWSFTNFYKVGKYASDGKFDPDLKDKQIGCVALLKYLE